MINILLEINQVGLMKSAQWDLSGEGIVQLEAEQEPALR